MNGQQVIRVRWFNLCPNWGDALNPVLIEFMSGRRVEWINTHDDTDTLRYIVIGSILEWADANTVVWGPGLLASDGRLSVKPKAVCAVRGPLTRNAVLGQGIHCPEVYGDPALLYPRYYDPPVRKRFELGIIPHYVDKADPWLSQLKASPHVLQIDIEGRINEVVDQVKACQRIASSSLHGLIAADAYGIPSTWIKFSDRVLGHGFKFKDYFLSVGRRLEDPLVIQPSTRLEEICDRFYEYRLDIDLDALYQACPFKK